MQNKSAKVVKSKMINGKAVRFDAQRPDGLKNPYGTGLGNWGKAWNNSKWGFGR